MKKCPFCAEEIQDEAVVCKHCHKELFTAPKPSPHLTQSIQTWKALGWIILFIASFFIWYITIPIGIAILTWNAQVKASKRNKIFVTLGAFILLIILTSVHSANAQPPTVTITEPANNATLQNQNVTIKGKVDPKSAKVTINGAVVSVDKNGAFSYVAVLPKENNTFAIQANKSDTNFVSTNLILNRTLTPEEQVKKQADLEAQQKAQAEADAKAKTDQAAYDKTPAGRLCKQNPTWSKDDCDKIAGHKFWIGMGFLMLKASLGSPDRAHTSNYGRGDEYQVCYDDLNPSCFYFDSTGIMTSYN